MAGYSTREVAAILGVRESRVRTYVRAGFLHPARGARRGFRFSFQDLLVLRAAEALVAARLPPRRVSRALRYLREQLPRGRSLSQVRIAAEGERIVVRDGAARWLPESGQTLFDFDASEVARQVAPLLRQAARTGRPGHGRLSPEDWYQWGCELEESSGDQAREAYRRALELEASHAGALVNLGRLLHQLGGSETAEAHYRRALEARPHDDVAAFNLGVALEDQSRDGDAARAYELALASNPDNADAHLNVAKVYERLGQKTLAVRHLEAYAKLSRRPS
jgi:tetratricopeptide (TPR) repeat protein